MTYPSVVLLQDPPVSKARLSLFSGFVLFFPPVRNPPVAAYIHRSFLSQFLVLLVFKDTDDVLALDVSSQEPLFNTSFHSFWLMNAYSTNAQDPRVYSVPPETLFPDLGVPLPVVGDLSIHNPLSDPRRSLSSQELNFSVPYFEKAAEGGFALLNPT